MDIVTYALQHLFDNKFCDQPLDLDHKSIKNMSELSFKDRNVSTGETIGTRQIQFQNLASSQHGLVVEGVKCGFTHPNRVPFLRLIGGTFSGACSQSGTGDDPDQFADEIVVRILTARDVDRVSNHGPPAPVMTVPAEITPLPRMPFFLRDYLPKLDTKRHKLTVTQPCFADGNSQKLVLRIR